MLDDVTQKKHFWGRLITDCQSLIDKNVPQRQQVPRHGRPPVRRREHNQRARQRNERVDKCVARLCPDASKYPRMPVKNKWGEINQVGEAVVALCSMKS